MTALTKFSVFSLVAVVCICLFIGMAVFAPTWKISQESTYYQVATLYNQVNSIHQSQKLGKQIEDIVKKRIDCYRLSPFDRISRCISGYTTELVELGRQKLQSAPDLSEFLEQVQLCPIVHAVCMGDIHEPLACASRESRCIDGMYDAYWRGRPFSQ